MMKKKNLNSYLALSQNLEQEEKTKIEPHDKELEELERVPEGGLVIDTNFVIQDVDRSFLEQHKLKREDIIGHFYSEISKLTSKPTSLAGMELDQKLKDNLEDIMLNDLNDQMFSKILHLILDTTQSLYGLFGYIDNHDNLVCPAVTRDVWDFNKDNYTTLKLPRDTWNGLWGQALRERRIIYSNGPFLPPDSNIKIRNCLIIPIMDHESTIGLLIVGDKEQDIRLKDREVVKNIAAFIAPILHSRLKQNYMHRSSNNMEELLRTCEQRYHSIFNTAPHLITSVDDNGKIVDCNNRVYDYLGYNRDEFIGLSIQRLIHPEFKNKAKSFLNLELPKGTSKREKFKMLRKDGSEIYVTIINSGLKIKREMDKTRGKILVIEEITDLKEHKKSMPDQARSAEAYLDILVHDISSLNKSINTYSELLLLKPRLSNQYKKYILTTLDYSRAISDLINNIRRLSNLSKNNIELRNIDVFKTLAVASDHIQQIYPLRQVRIKQSISESEVIVQSSEMLKDAFLNILSNAVKFDKHNEVVIEIIHSLSKDKKFWKLEFKDHGPGVSDEMKNKIFNDFEIGIDNIHGSGLGLAVVKEVINNSNGKIWVEDRIMGDSKKGSNFVLLLPRGK